MRIKSIFFFFMFVSASLSGFAEQSSFGAAYRVNGTVITHYEIDQVSRILQGTGTPSEAAYDEAVDFLINYRLLDTEAKLVGLEVEDVMIDRTIESFAGGAEKTKEYTAKLAQAGIAPNMMREFVRGRILRQMYGESRSGKPKISSEEIANRINNIPDQVVKTILIGEIVLPYEVNGGRIPTTLLSNEIRTQLAAGTPFEDLARQYSYAQTRTSGGRLPPIPLEGMSPELSKILANTSPGHFSKNIETQGAIAMVYYIGQGEIRNSLPRDPYFSYVVLPVPAGKNAQSFADSLYSCDYAKQLVGGEKSKNIHMKTSTKNIDAATDMALRRISAGDAVVLDAKTVLYLCDVGVDVPEKLEASIKSRVYADALENEWDGYIQELRSLANIRKIE